MSPWVHAGVRAVFFDAVGTLLSPDPPVGAVYAAVARDQGVALDPADIRPRFAAAFAAEEMADRAAEWVTSEAREEQRWRRIVATVLPELPDPEAGFRRLFDHFARPTAWQLYPDVPAVFAALRRRGVAVGVASNFDARLLGVVAGFPHLELVAESVIVSSLVGFRKPAAGFFDAVERAAGCDRARILFVGDDLVNDYDGATAAGFAAVLLDEHGRHEATARRVRSLGELLG